MPVQETVQNGQVRGPRQLRPHQDQDPQDQVRLPRRVQPQEDRRDRAQVRPQKNLGLNFIIKRNFIF